MFNIIKVMKKEYKCSVYLLYHLDLSLFLFSDAGTGETSTWGSICSESYNSLFENSTLLVSKRFLVPKSQVILNDFFTLSSYTSFVVAVAIV